MKSKKKWYSEEKDLTIYIISPAAKITFQLCSNRMKRILKTGKKYGISLSPTFIQYYLFGTSSIQEHVKSSKPVFCSAHWGSDFFSI